MKIKANGIEVNCELSGNRDGQVVMMSHSLGSSLIMWNPQMPALAEKYRILRYDTRGHGATSAPRGPYAMNTLVDDALALLDALDIDQVHWMGLSMGGMIGQGLALQSQQRLCSLLLCDTMAVIREQTKEMWRNRIHSSERFGLHKVVDFAMERWFTEPFRSDENDEYAAIREQFLATPVAGYVGCCHAIYSMNFLDELAAIELPTHIIVGDADLATPVAESQAIAERIKGTTLDIIPDAAHLSNIEQAEIFNQSLLKFLSSL